MRGFGSENKLWRDERGFWSIPLSIFILTMTIPFLYFIMDIGNARYVRSVTYSAADAASLAGAAQSMQRITATGPLGEPTSWDYVVETPRGTDHATQTLFHNMNEYLAKGVTVESYTITYPDVYRCRVDVTVTYPAQNITNALKAFFGFTGQIQARTHLYAQSKVTQPTP